MILRSAIVEVGDMVAGCLRLAAARALSRGPEAGLAPGSDSTAGVSAALLVP